MLRHETHTAVGTSHTFWGGLFCCFVCQVLHTRRLHAPTARARDAVELIRNLKEEHMLYASPYGSNDDWYWIYAAIKAGGGLGQFGP